jgi:phage terminase large subunit-like protein
VLSIAEQLALLPSHDRVRVLNELAPTVEEKENLLYSYKFLARPKQYLPLFDPYLYYIILAGRGFGKTWTGSQALINLAMRQPVILGVSNSTARDTRDTNVEGGVSSIIKMCPPWFQGRYNSSKNLVTFPNGSVIHTFSGEKPDSLRGYQFHYFWVDEFAKYRYPTDFIDQLLLCMRLPELPPKIVITTTPRPIKTLVNLVEDNRNYVVRGSTYENKSNLSPIYLREIEKRYAGTRLGRQEIEADILTDTPGALWTYDILERNRATVDYNSLVKIVIGVDPAVSSTTNSNQTGIVVAGIDENNIGYILDDQSGVYTPTEWAELVVRLYDDYKANEIVAEVNNGGDLVVSNIQTHTKILKRPLLPVTKVYATRGKYLRAEPISTLYTHGQVKHVGVFAELEDELCTWVPGEKSPDRLDALVWALTKLMVNKDEVQEFKDIKLW